MGLSTALCCPVAHLSKGAEGMGFVFVQGLVLLSWEGLGWAHEVDEAAPSDTEHKALRAPFQRDSTARVVEAQEALVSHIRMFSSFSDFVPKGAGGGGWG